ncbi:lip and palate transmembrane protein 1-like protein [Seminavis robusta]|uniref:Lip and palate transmembrane protein 1-like protein n=1 Tax=Seminavis robusta TaxID=568900 RepID=A0A9N8DJN2_9STRA|nr:lip and palate transmembrane protein 1-like protein [Seminavis robusta]|eukprot:Sro120_g058500.1 lip and palate transmembrane protein 1-like protein (794) ;mRNA; r:56336-59164
MALRNVCSVSFFASALMALYIGLAGYNMYLMMYPLATVDLSVYSEQQMVHPLWDHGTTMDMRVYLSTRSKFHVNFLQADFLDDQGQLVANAASEEQLKNLVPPNDVALLWQQKLTAPSLSKSFLITSLDQTDDQSCQADPSFLAAQTWLDQAEKSAWDRGEGGVLSAIHASGQGIESTSFLLTLYYAMSRQVQSFLAFLGMAEPPPLPEENNAALQELKADRTIISLPAPLWNALRSNSTIQLHVMVMRQYKSSAWEQLWPPKNIPDATNAAHKASRAHALLLGGVNMVKFEEPHHIHKPTRILYHDVFYLFRRYILQRTDEQPPWDFAYSKPNEHAIYQSYLDMKQRGAGYPYWKPEVSIKYVKDEESYPLPVLDYSGMKVARLPRPTQDHPTGVVHLPALYSSEIGLTSDKFIPMNETVTSLPLRVSFDRSDVDSHGDDKNNKNVQSKITTATAGAISPARWRLLSHLTEALEAQKNLGFEASDIDEVKNLIADTNITLLAITMLASALHLLFEFLTFREEVNFWRRNKSLQGLSIRALFIDAIGQTVILLYLIDRESSLLMVGPSAIGCLIAFWKCQRGAGLIFVKTNDNNHSTAWWNSIVRLSGYELRATRMETSSNKEGESNDEGEGNQDLIAVTLEADRMAIRSLGVVMAPVVLGYIFYSFVYDEHIGWYSWLVTSASSAVYGVGFALMFPQLFLNYKLKSVAHLPWQVLIYKSLNTFIDDLFSFIVRMPTMARISCFRDDVVFFIYLYQRWLYPVDLSRPAEGGGEAVAENTTSTNGKLSDTKKKQ